VAVGLAIGVTPLYGLHFWLVIAVCVPLRLDAALAYVAANISLPFVAPFLLLAEVEIGSWATTGHGMALTVDDVKSRALGEMLRQVVVGTAIFAPAIAAVGGGLAFGIAARARRRRPHRGPPPVLGAGGAGESDAVERVARRYAEGRRATYHYVRSKLASDPVAERVASMGDLGEVIDVGCGRGQLAALLLETGAATRVRGVDWDEAKIADARRALAGLAASFDRGDARTCDLGAGDTVLLVDVLHYFTDEEQDALLDRAASAARRTLVVRELDPDRGWRSAVTRLQERITTGLRFNVGARVRPRAISATTRRLEARGFEVTVEPCWGSTPFANVLVVARRRRNAG
jgi:SAM-dependent methyltransferase